MSASERDDKLAMLDRLLPGVRVVPGDDILTIRAPAGKK
jgi:hypothetical protein